MGLKFTGIDEGVALAMEVYLDSYQRGKSNIDDIMRAIKFIEEGGICSVRSGPSWEHLVQIGGDLQFKEDMVSVLRSFARRWEERLKELEVAIPFFGEMRNEK